MRNRRGPWRPKRWLLSILLAVAVALAPLWITITHGPGALLMAVERRAEVSALKDAHEHAHAGEEAQPEHDPSDHDHQAIAWTPQTGSIVLLRPNLEFRLPIIAMALEPEAPERPPRVA